MSLRHRQRAALKDKIDDAWNNDVFIPTVGKRAVPSSKPVASSSASAANAAIDHMRDWALGTNGEWVTMGIPSDGSYGIPEGIQYGVAVTCANGEYTRDRPRNRRRQPRPAWTRR